MGWIIISRWDEFQHRDMARSTVPPWIKNLTRLLSDEAYLNLTWQQRGLLHALWLEYARTRRQLPDSTLSLSRRLGGKVTRASLEALNHAGFIQFSASNPASTPASDLAGLEVEGEVEREPKAVTSKDHVDEPEPETNGHEEFTTEDLDYYFTTIAKEIT